MAKLKNYDIEVLADGESQAIEIGATDEADARRQVLETYGEEATIVSIDEDGEFEGDPEFAEDDEDEED